MIRTGQGLFRVCRNFSGCPANESSASSLSILFKNINDLIFCIKENNYFSSTFVVKRTGLDHMPKDLLHVTFKFGPTAGHPGEAWVPIWPYLCLAIFVQSNFPRKSVRVVWTAVPPDLRDGGTWSLGTLLPLGVNVVLHAKYQPQRSNRLGAHTCITDTHIRACSLLLYRQFFIRSLKFVHILAGYFEKRLCEHKSTVWVKIQPSIILHFE